MPPAPGWSASARGRGRAGDADLLGGGRLAHLRARWADRLPEADLAALDEATAFATRAAYLNRLHNAPDDAILVKLADRLSNVQRLDTHPRPGRRRAYYDETVHAILPLAERHPWFHAWYGTWRTQFPHLTE